MGRDTVLGLIAERETGCRTELDRLVAESERIAGLVEACRRKLARLATAREVVGELSEVETVVSKASGVDSGTFPQWAVDVWATFGRPVRCREVAEALGEDPAVARSVERVRRRLKRLAETGRIIEVDGGAFTLPGESG